jgi:hypothetical protein
MSRLARRIFSAAVLLPLLLFALAGTSAAGWRCSLDGVIRDHCCCPGADRDDQPADSQAAISAADCCSIEQQQSDKAPTELVRATAAGVVPAFVALPVSVLAPPTPSAVAHGGRPPRDPTEAAHGRALLLRKQTFLI